MVRRLYVLATILAAITSYTSPSLAQSSKLGDLFNQVAPAPAPEIGVDIVTWIERNQGQSYARLSIMPQNGARLVADPGITVTPIIETLGAWVNESEISHVIEGQSYFESPPILDLGLVIEDGRPLSANVHFAYCLVDDICLFGEETVSIATKSTD